MRSILGSGAIISGEIVALPAFNDPSVVQIPIIVATVLVACLLLFQSPTVTVSREYILLEFGIGLIETATSEELSRIWLSVGCRYFQLAIDSLMFDSSNTCM